MVSVRIEICIRFIFCVCDRLSSRFSGFLKLDILMISILFVCWLVMFCGVRFGSLGVLLGMGVR